MGAAPKVVVQDLDEASRFLEVLTGVTQRAVTFQTFDDSGQGRRHLSRILHGDICMHGETLAKLNAQGAGVFVMVNAGDGRGRREENVQSVRAYFLDLDGAPLPPVLTADLTPHVVVESSPGKWHAYWLVADGVPAQFKRVQKALAARFEGDPKVCDLPRVMRVPGFWHCKAIPFVSRLDRCIHRPPYTHSEIIDWLDLGHPANEPEIGAQPRARVLPATIPEGERNSTLFALAVGLAKQGYGVAAVSGRIQTINRQRCRPSLDPAEVQTIAAQACAYGSDGWSSVPHALLDSPEWKSLSPPAGMIAIAFYRRFNGHNNGRLSVTWDDLNGAHGIKRRSFYKYLSAVVAAGVIFQVSEAHNSQSGAKPALYGIPDRFLAQVQNLPSAPSAMVAPLSK